MKQQVILILVWWSTLFSVQGQLTIHITSVPATTPAGSSIYIAGNFNNWNPGNAAYKLSEDGQGGYSITFSPATGALEFKFTRGGWDTVEGTSAGGFLPNRTYTYSGSASTLNLAIAGWENVSPHTATDNVQILDEDFYIPQLDRHRRIWIYLPPDYTTSSKQYPVIYMHDGQNLFDVFYSFAGEWKIDESMNELFSNGDYGAIVVGIDNGGAERINEFSPWVNSSYGGGDGEAYVSFIVNTLKPHIDSTFRTLPGREYTATIGSSLGGLISMYAVSAYPEVFGKAGIFSPSLWFSDSVYLQVMQQTFTDDIRIYFVGGENESQGMVPDMLHMQDVLLAEGIEASNIKVDPEADGAHSEWFWAREYPDAYKWLFQDLVLKTNMPAEKKINVFPNPASNVLFLDPPAPGKSFSIVDITGHSQMTGICTSNWINISGLSAGVYVLVIGPEDGLITQSRFIKY